MNLILTFSVHPIDSDLLPLWVRIRCLLLVLNCHCVSIIYVPSPWSISLLLPQPPLFVLQYTHILLVIIPFKVPKIKIQRLRRQRASQIKVAYQLILFAQLSVLVGRPDDFLIWPQIGLLDLHILPISKSGCLMI